MITLGTVYYDETRGQHVVLTEDDGPLGPVYIGVGDTIHSAFGTRRPIGLSECAPGNPGDLREVRALEWAGEQGLCSHPEDLTYDDVAEFDVGDANDVLTSLDKIVPREVVSEAPGRFEAKYYYDNPRDQYIVLTEEDGPEGPIYFGVGDSPGTAYYARRPIDMNEVEPGSLRILRALEWGNDPILHEHELCSHPSDLEPVDGDYSDLKYPKC